ncbi:MAG: tetratricopeptide repeat protein [Capsulimonas sp.]|uniref:ATP-binding protein n=1 Tax=Capsulimonas sp. TaxID=2494211 RepID=UPI003267048A
MTTPEAGAPPLTITFFGPMRVMTHGRPAPRLRSRKTLWLLALLTLRHGRPVEREWLAGALWPDAGRDQAFAGLRPILTELRQTLQTESSRLQSPSRHTLLLDLTGADVDLLTFDAAMASGDLQAMERAVDLYRAPLLEGCAEEWAEPERTDRETRLLHALGLLSQNALAMGSPEVAAEFCRRAVAIDPWRDTAQREWMEALVQTGDSNAALQVYRNFVDLLRSDPLAAPDAQISALYAQLRKEGRQRREPMTAEQSDKPKTLLPQISGYLPVPLTDLIGRDTERRELAAELERSRLVTITGPGGVGKTRLAIEVASEIAARFPDGVWMAALETLTDSTMTTARIASLLGVREEPGRATLESITDHLRRKSLLLVLDNCEHLLDSCAWIAAHLLRECAGVRILATSRESLGVVGETAWAAPSLSIPPPDDFGGEHASPKILSQYDSAQLFVERAKAAKRTFTLTEANLRSVAQICRRTEGIPLAIELAAARIPSMTPRQIEERLSDYLGLLTMGGRTSPSRQQTLRGTLDWSYALLGEQERLLLGRLSLFAGGWSLEAAQRVHPEDPRTPALVLDLLNALVGKSLVVFEENGRYRLLEMVRQYAAEHLEASGEAAEVKNRHCDFFLDLAEEAEPYLQGRDQETWMRLLDCEHGNLRAALSWARDAQTLLRLTGALARFWIVRGYYLEGREHLRAALERTGAPEATSARAKALTGAGAISYFQGDHTAARAQYEEALDIYRNLGDNLGAASALAGLGNVAGAQGHHATTQQCYEETLSIRRDANDKHGIANALNALGSVSLVQGDYPNAKTRYQEGLSIYRELGDKYGAAAALAHCGDAEYVQGKYPEARTLYEESQTIYQELNHRRGVADALGSLGNVAHETGDYVSARTLYEESLRLRRELGERRGVGTLLSRLADVAISEGDGDSARRLHRESLRIHQEMDDWGGMAQNLNGLAAAMLMQSQAFQAAKFLGAVHELLGNRGSAPSLYEQRTYALQIEETRQALGPSGFSAAWEEGRTLTWEQVTALGLED